LNPPFFQWPIDPLSKLMKRDGTCIYASQKEEL